MKRYIPSEIEPKWQQIWADTGINKVTEDTSRPKYYMLTEFPYPSGEGLHAGHIREYTIGDTMARYKRMQGHNVLFPFGFDEFGLPTENYAIKHKIAPQIATDRNVATFRKQLDQLGYMIDWDRQVHTSDPGYYKWTQWLFLQFLKAGLAYQAEIAINWCPFEKTGLANEEVVNGKHERCGTPVEKKLLKQWILKITDYADRLIEGLKTVDYPSRIADQQINWIGRSEGAEIDFQIKGVNLDANNPSKLTVYTTRPDTIFGATFIVVAPEIVTEWMTRSGYDAPPAVKAYVDKAIAKAELERQESKDKTGVDTGVKAVHPLSGDEIPVWVADYVLAGYGTGAIMAVPAHDERDHEFASKFGLDIKPVVAQDFGKPLPDCKDVEGSVVIGYDLATKQYLGLKNHNGELGWLISGGREDGETFADTARRELAEEAGYHHPSQMIQLGDPVYSYYYNDNKRSNRRSLGVNYLAIVDRDDLGQTHHESHERFSPQWMSFTELYADIKATAGGVKHWLDALDKAKQAVAAIEAGVTYEPPIYTGSGPLINSGDFNGLDGDAAKSAIIEKLKTQGSGRGSKKYKLRDWVFSRQHYWGEPIPVIHCPKDGVVAVPEAQLPVMLPEVESYEPTDTGESPLAAMTDWLNVDCPKCGGPAKRETDTMPNWAGSNWYYLRYMDARNEQAFVGKTALNYWKNVDMYLGGMEHTTLHLLYSRFCHQFLYDQKLIPTPEPYQARRGQGIVLAADGRKMSKSLGNVVNPSDIVAKYGADSLRLYVMFMAPYDETTPWSDERLGGVNRFVFRSWTLVQQLISGTGEQALTNATPDGTFTTEVDRLIHKTLKKVHDDLGGMRFNTAIAALMELLNELNSPKINAVLLEPRHAALASRTAKLYVLMLAPLAPFLAEELWHELGEQGSVHVAGWPEYDPALIKDDVVELAVQVNGKLRGTILAAADANEAEVTAAAKANVNVAKYLEGTIVKTVVVPRRLVNFVVK